VVAVGLTRVSPDGKHTLFSPDLKKTLEKTDDGVFGLASGPDGSPCRSRPSPQPGRPASGRHDSEQDQQVEVAEVGERLLDDECRPLQPGEIGLGSERGNSQRSRNASNAFISVFPSHSRQMSLHSAFTMPRSE
jgi:hypothetical protein